MKKQNKLLFRNGTVGSNKRRSLVTAITNDLEGTSNENRQMTHTKILYHLTVFSTIKERMGYIMAEITCRKGIYKIRVYLGKDVNGRKITESTTFTPTKKTPKAIEKEVQEFASNYEKQVKEGKLLSGEKLSLADVVEEWKQDQTFKDLTKSVQESYVDILSEYDCILSPDFSLYMDMPMALKIWNIYRSRWIGAYYQKKGLNVIPTASWAEPETYEFCFQGIPKGSIVSVSTIGVKKEESALKVWIDGMKEMIRRIEPETILVYGGELPFDYGDIPVRYYENKVTEQMKRES